MPLNPQLDFLGGFAKVGDIDKAFPGEQLAEVVALTNSLGDPKAVAASEDRAKQLKALFDASRTK